MALKNTVETTPIKECSANGFVLKIYHYYEYDPDFIDEEDEDADVTDEFRFVMEKDGKEIYFLASEDLGEVAESFNTVLKMLNS